MGRLPTYYLSHGGGPWPWFDHQGMYDKLAASLCDISARLAEVPKAILMVSAHWETREFTVMTHPRPPMIYDFGGFPAHTYQVQYQAPGSPELASRVMELAAKAGIPMESDATRGFDHGAYTPLALMYPNADMTVVQLSIRRNFDPTAHMELGHALASLRDEGILIIGSGLSYHNLRWMDERAKAPSAAFDQWLADSLLNQTPSERQERLKEWSKAPLARQAHPREDHLLPLMVAVGAAGDDPASMIYHEDAFMGSWTVSSYQFG